MIRRPHGPTRAPEPRSNAGGRLATAATAAFLLSSFIGLALAYRHAIPLFEAPDEPSHLHYAVFVSLHGRLPRQQPREVPGEGMQPPLAYLAAAPLVGQTGLDAAAVSSDLHEVGLYVYGLGSATPGGPSIAFVRNGKRFFRSDGSLRALATLRGTSLVFSFLAVLFTFAGAWRISEDARLSLLAGALLAFNPQFLYVSGYFSNDPAAVAVAAATLWVVVDAVGRGGPVLGHYVAGAVLIALGILSKTSTVPSLVVAAATVVAIDRRAARTRLRDGAVATGVALLLAGPYLFWATAHRGGFLGLGAVYASASELHVPAGQLPHYLSRYYWRFTFESYWCRFGWMNIPAPSFVYAAFFALSATGVLGWLFAGRRPPGNPLVSRGLRGYLFASVAATAAAHLVLNLTVVAAQGRHLFAIAPQFALLLALGIDRIAGERRMLLAALVIVTALVALDLYCLQRVLSPAYASFLNVP